MDLGSCVYGSRRLPVRRLVALIRRLPAGSVTSGSWTWAEELAASLLELTDAHWQAWFKANGALRQVRPLRVPRPGDSRKKKRPASVAEMAALFSGGRR